MTRKRGIYQKSKRRCLLKSGVESRVYSNNTKSYSNKHEKREVAEELAEEMG